MWLLDHILLPDLKFVANAAEAIISPSKNAYKWDILMASDNQVKEIQVYIDDELIDTIPHDVFYSKWDTLSIEYNLHEKLVW